MQETQRFQEGLLGCFIGLLSIALAIGAVAISANYHYPHHAACHGMLGAGFPVLFICDNWGGGSPTGSWSKIDFVDVVNGGIRPGGFFVDFLFYILLILIIWLVVSGFLRKGVMHGDSWGTVFMITAFAFGIIFAFLIVWSSDSYIKHPPIGTPTPVTPSATASEIAPIATSIP